MGRPKTVRTPEEMEQRNAERKAKYYSEAYNARRRERYQQDKSYREAEKARARLAGREDRVSFPDPREAIKHLNSFGAIRDVITPVGERRFTVLSFEELATAMGRNVYLLYRWRKAGRFPSGVVYFRDERGGQPTQAFTLEEARVLMKIIGEHLENSQYYLAEHTETAEKIRQGIEAVRAEKGWTTSGILQ